MLDFLDLAPQAQAAKTGPEAIGRTLELVNVKASGNEVKYLFVNRAEYHRIFPFWDYLISINYYSRSAPLVH